MIDQNQKPQTRRERIRNGFLTAGAVLGGLFAIIGLVQVASEGGPIRRPILLIGIFMAIGAGLGWVVGSVVASLFPESVPNEDRRQHAGRTSADRETDPSQQASDQERVQKSAQEYLSELDEWGVRNGISGDLLYYKEWAENPAVGIFLLSRVESGAISEAQLASLAFMAGMLIGVRQLREGSAWKQLPDDYERQHTKAVEWVKHESEQGRAGLHADSFLTEMREFERNFGCSRGTLADSEASRDARVQAFLEFSTDCWGRDLRTLAMSVFRVGLVAGTRTYIEGYVKEAVR